MSHAIHAASFRTYSQALIAVLDRQGIQGEWNSFYLADENDIHLMAQDVIPATSRGGIGAAYAAVSDLLGYPGETQAGTTMALAGYGRPRSLPLLVKAEDGSLYAAFGQSLSEYLRQSGHGPWLEAILGKEFQAQADFAATMQQQMETMVSHRLGSLCNLHGCHEVILGGGVATNCQLIGTLRRTLPDIVVRTGFAPGDTGQALGNALYGWSKILGQPLTSAMRHPCLGPEALPLDEVIFSRTGTRKANRTDLPQALKLAVEVLMRGGVLGLCHGRSEYGPRALGHRSLLAHPGLVQVRERLTQIKSRAWFRPFGVVWMEGIPGHDSDEWLRGWNTPSPFMEAALPLSLSWRQQLPALPHVDSTCRIQTMGEVFAGEPLDLLLREFHQASGLPCLLNTSFNRAGEPMVETGADALAVAQGMGLDALWLPHQGVFFAFRKGT